MGNRYVISKEIHFSIVFLGGLTGNRYVTSEGTNFEFIQS